MSLKLLNNIILPKQASSKHDAGENNLKSGISIGSKQASEFSQLIADEINLDQLTKNSSEKFAGIKDIGPIIELLNKDESGEDILKEKIKGLFNLSEDEMSTILKDVKNLKSEADVNNLSNGEEKLETKLGELLKMKTPDLDKSSESDIFNKLGKKSEKSPLITKDLKKSDVSNILKTLGKNNIQPQKEVNDSIENNDFIKTFAASRNISKGALNSFTKNSNQTHSMLFNDKDIKLKVEGEGTTNEDVSPIQNFKDFMISGADTRNNSDSNMQMKTEVSTPVIDLSNSSISSEKMIDKIVNYIDQTRLNNSEDVEVLVKHNELGQFKVSASKNDSGHVDVTIKSQSNEAHKFFLDNESKISSKIQSAGIKLADIKMVVSTESSSSESKMNQDGSFKNSQSFSQSFSSSSRNHQGSHQQREERRDAHWKLYEDQTERMSA